MHNQQLYSSLFRSSRWNLETSEREINTHTQTRTHRDTPTHQIRCRRPRVVICRGQCCCRKCWRPEGRGALKTAPPAASPVYFAAMTNPAARCIPPFPTGMTQPWRMCPKKKDENVWAWINHYLVIVLLPNYIITSGAKLNMELKVC